MKRLSSSLFLTVALLLGCAGLLACSRGINAADALTPLQEPNRIPEGAKLAYFAGGCFWCTEEVFHQVPGVISVMSGYMGGSEKDPNYDQVSAGKTGHAESVQVVFDPAQTSFEKLLEVFWKAHDPTELNRQGPDEGAQYRSAIFYADEAQRAAAEKSKAELAKSGTYSKPVVTQIVKADTFYPAEEYHQNFYRKHPDHPYVRRWLLPKLKKLGMKTL